MNRIVTRTGLTPRHLALAGLLLILAPLANLFQIPILFDVYLIFGSLATMLAVLWLGTPVAVLVAISAGLVTAVLWNHPYALINFTVEALVVGLLHRRWHHNLIMADLAYWLVLGMPFIGFSYFFLLGNDASTTALIVLKHPLNGVLNALLASLLALGVRALQGRRGQLGVADGVFVALLLGITVAGTLPIAIEGHRDQRVQEQFVTQRLQDNAELLADRLAQNARRQQEPLDHYLRQAQASSNMGLAALDLNGQPIARQGTVNSLQLTQGELTQTRNGGRLWLPTDVSHPLKRWQAGAYSVRYPVHNTPGVAAVLVELPAAPLVERIRTNQLRLLASLFAVVMVGSVLARLLSLWLTRPLRHLTQASQGLTERITSGQQPGLPASLFREYDDLGRSFSTVSSALADAFGQLNEAHDSLARQVESKTAEILDTNILLDSVLNAATEASIIATDTDGLITIFNRGAEQMLGYRASEMVGRGTPMLFHDASEVQARGEELSEELGRPVSGFEVFIARAITGEAEIHDWTYIHRNGRRFPVSLIVTPITDSQGQITGYLGLAIDVSERRRMDKLKDEFISTVSHELRTPLTSISGSLSLLLGGAAGEVSAPLKPMLTIADNNAKRLIHLVNDLLDLQKIASGRMEFHLQTLTLADLLNDAVEQNRPYGQERQVALELAQPLPAGSIQVDRERLLQALANLISNAIKFSPDQATVTVRTRTLADGRVAIDVEDHGCGIPAHFHDRLFQRFAQADASDTRSKGGTGLGLAITRELVERMGGEVGFTSEEGSGSTFTITLPLSPADAPYTVVRPNTEARPTTSPTRAPVPAERAKRVTTRPQVLHVEDDQDLHSVIRAATANRFELAWAATLEEARHHLKLARFELVILDIGLPDGNGWQLLPELYQHQPDAHIVILSGKALDPEELAKVQASFTKSQTSLDVLITSLEACLERLPEEDRGSRSD